MHRGRNLQKSSHIYQVSPVKYEHVRFTNYFKAYSLKNIGHFFLNTKDIYVIYVN